MNTLTTACNIPCAGDSTQSCGGTYAAAMDLYQSDTPPPPPPTLVPNIGNGSWTYLGCYKYAYVPCLCFFGSSSVSSLRFADSHSSAEMILGTELQVKDGQYSMSVESCTETCFSKGYVIAGIEFPFAAVHVSIFSFDELFSPNQHLLFQTVAILSLILQW